MPDKSIPAFLLAVCLTGTAARAETAYALDSNVLLVKFDTNTPFFIESSKAIRGLLPGEHMLGLDFRPANGQLYGLGSTGRIYTINLETAAATAVSPAPFARLEGTAFGFDFNPTVDRIRIVSNTGQNLRVHPDTGALVAADGRLNQKAEFGAPSIVGAAYTNSVAGATSTTLYGIDSERRVLVTQIPPNDGTLNDVGVMNIDLADVAGFDISPRTGIAYVVARARSVVASGIYQVDLATGASSQIGWIEGNDQISGIAIPTR